MRAVQSTNAPISFEIVDNITDRLTPEALSSAKRTGCVLKGEFVTGIGKGSKVSVNIELRKALQLYANVVHSFVSRAAACVPGCVA